jgi:hypothetical protein
MAKTDPNQTPPAANLPVQASVDLIAEEHRKTCGTYQRRIQQAIFRISEKARAAERANLDRYIRLTSPQMARSGESEFPNALRRHVRDDDRHGFGILPSLLFFHVGNAIFTYYELVLGRAEAREALDRRVTLLEQIAAKGLEQFRRIGTEGEGFTLIHKDEQPVPFSTTNIDGDDDYTEKA